VGLERVIGIGFFFLAVARFFLGGFSLGNFGGNFFLAGGSLG
jgi:hypothetical protein